MDCQAHRTISRRAVEKSEAGGKSCCQQMNLTKLHWKRGAEAIVDGCLGMEISEQQSCGNQPGCPQAEESFGSCPHNWFSFQQFCFSVWTQKLSWLEAEKVSKAVDGNLASILTEDENAFVSMLLTSGNFWIGASNMNFDRQWRWTDGSEWANISGWQKPIVRRQHRMVIKGALAIDLRGEWTTHSPREDKLPFVCKRSRDGDRGRGGDGQDLFWFGILASTALVLLLALVILVLAILVFTRGRSKISRNSK